MVMARGTNETSRFSFGRLPTCIVLSRRSAAPSARERMRKLTGKGTSGKGAICTAASPSYGAAEHAQARVRVSFVPRERTNRSHREGSGPRAKCRQFLTAKRLSSVHTANDPHIHKTAFACKLLPILTPLFCRWFITMRRTYGGACETLRCAQCGGGGKRFGGAFVGGCHRNTALWAPLQEGESCTHRHAVFELLDTPESRGDLATRATRPRAIKRRGKKKVNVGEKEL